MNASPARLLAVQTGRVAPLGPRAVPSAIRKTTVAGPVAVATLGCAGDEQADLAVHGGPDKAVYAYDAGGFPGWAADFPALTFEPGAMGENLTLVGWNESDVMIGDVHRIGTALLQVTQPREPCYKLALHLGEPMVAKAMLRSGRSGWYYRVLAGGIVAAGDAATLVERLQSGWSVRRFGDAVMGKDKPRALLIELADLPGLATRWPAKLRRAAGIA